MGKLISRFFSVRAGEWSKVSLLASYVLCANAILVIMRSVTNALFLGVYDAKYIPHLLAAQALFFVLVSVAYSAISAKVSRKVEVIGLFFIVLASLVLSRWFLTYEQKWFIFFLYVWVETFTLVLLMQCWILINDAFDARSAKRLFPLVGGGGTLGAVIGGFSATGLAGVIGAENLIFCCLPLLLIVMLAGQSIIAKHIEACPAPASSAEIQKEGIISGLFKGFSIIFKDGLLKLLFIFVVTAIFAYFIIDFQFKAILGEEFSTDDIAIFLGTFFAVANLVTLFVHLFVENRFLIAFGLTMGLLTLPFLMFSGSAVFVIFPVLWAIVATKFLGDVMYFSLAKAGEELAYNPIPLHRKQRVKITFEGIVKPGAQFIASIALIILVSTNLFDVLDKIERLSILSLIICALGVVACIFMKKPYIEKLKEALSNRKLRLKDNPELGDLIDRHSKELVEHSLAEGIKSDALFSLQLIKEFQLPVDISKVESLYQNDDWEIRTEALKTIEAVGNESQMEKIVRLLETEKHPKVKAEAIKALRCITEAN